MNWSIALERTLNKSTPAPAFSTFEFDIPPEIGRKLTLIGRVSASWGAICLHPSWCLAVANVRVRVSE